MESQQQHPQQFSFEFFPPKTSEGAEKLVKVRNILAELDPKYFSVTFGAGGSTQQGTIDTVTSIKEAGFGAAPACQGQRSGAFTGAGSLPGCDWCNQKCGG